MKNDKAVSPAIGVILMLIITVILAAVIAFYGAGNIMVGNLIPKPTTQGEISGCFVVRDTIKDGVFLTCESPSGLLPGWDIYVNDHGGGDFTPALNKIATKSGNNYTVFIGCFYPSEIRVFRKPQSPYLENLILSQTV